MRGFLFGIACLLSVFGSAPSGAEVVIGMAGPLTGPNAWIGEQTQIGVEAAFDDLLAHGGVLAQAARVVKVDDFCRGDQAVAAARKLVADGVAVVIGHQCSGAAIPASEVYAEAGILMISNAATNPKLTDRGLNNVFRMLGRDDQQGQMAGRYLAERWRDRKIAILHDGELYGEDLATYTKQQLNAQGVSEVMFEQIEPGRVDYSDLVARMQALGVDVLYYGGYAPEAGLIVRQASDKGYGLQLVAGDGISSGDFRLIAGDAADGTLMTLYPDLRASPKAADVVARFRARHYEPDGATLLAYAAVQVWKQAVEKASTLRTAAVAAALHTKEFDTLVGRIGFDEKGDVYGYEPFVWYIWQEGKYVPLESTTARQ
jgi:branched-chain amino acid transport system substrate-binding protein